MIRHTPSVLRTDNPDRCSKIFNRSQDINRKRGASGSNEKRRNLVKSGQEGIIDRAVLRHGLGRRVESFRRVRRGKKKKKKKKSNQPRPNSFLRKFFSDVSAWIAIERHWPSPGYSFGTLFMFLAKHVETNKPYSFTRNENRTRKIPRLS